MFPQILPCIHCLSTLSFINNSHPHILRQILSFSILNVLAIIKIFAFIFCSKDGYTIEEARPGLERPNCPSRSHGRLTSSLFTFISHPPDASSPTFLPFPRQVRPTMSICQAHSTSKSKQLFREQIFPEV